jgi:(p)ppGpp synthase/HD superfamily hydrolase
MKGIIMFDKLINIKDDLNNAFTIAIYSHMGQTDKAGNPYILHPIRLFTQVHTNKTKIVALLHDVIKDSNLTLEKLKPYFSNNVIEALDAITKKPGEEYMDYLARVNTNEIARHVKYLDLRDNLDPQRLNQLKISLRVRLSRKYKDALRYLLKEGL